MTNTLPIDKEALLRALDELSPEAVAEVHAFIEFQKYKAQPAPSAPAVAIKGWLVGFHFDEQLITQARTELWGRF
jgi:hypothetical protein